jgi:hypothetical protein
MPTMPLLRRGLLVVFLCSAAVLAGCGRKGPLYLPPPPPAASGPVEQPPATPAASDAEPKPAAPQPDR